VVVLWRIAHVLGSLEALLFFACVSARLKHGQMRMRVCIGRIAGKDMAVSCRVDDKLSHKLNTGAGWRCITRPCRPLDASALKAEARLYPQNQERERQKERSGETNFAISLCSHNLEEFGCRASSAYLRLVVDAFLFLHYNWIINLFHRVCSIYLVITELWKKYINMLKMLKIK